jgi:hypothetical protein
MVVLLTSRDETDAHCVRMVAEAIVSQRPGDYLQLYAVTINVRVKRVKAKRTMRGDFFVIA